MRLTASQHTTLVAAVRRHFGPQARLWLFGSRVDDSARGGDFDLMVQADGADAHALYGAKLALLADLHATLEFEGERIDVVLLSPALDATLRPLQRKALANGLELSTPIAFVTAKPCLSRNLRRTPKLEARHGTNSRSDPC